MADWLHRQYRKGATIIGVCGGFQMLGDKIVDTECCGIEIRHCFRLGFIRATTRLVPYKTMRLVTAHTHSGIPFEGYEIHMGMTTVEDAVLSVRSAGKRRT
jgi:adenosylcobyric acid synthase